MNLSNQDDSCIASILARQSETKSLWSEGTETMAGLHFCCLVTVLHEQSTHFPMTWSIIFFSSLEKFYSV